MKEFLPLPAGYSPAAEGNITWNLDADRVRYVEFHELIHTYRDAQLGSDTVSNAETTLSRQRRFNALCAYQSSIPIGSSDQFLDTYLILPQQHVAVFNLEGTQVRQAYTTVWNYDTVATDIDILTYIRAFLDNPVVDPLDGYDQYNRPNWDGFGAEPITPKTLHYARQMREMLPDAFGEPHIAPGADGSIGFYWSVDRGLIRSLCIDLGPGEKWRAYWQLRNGGFDNLPSRQVDHTTRSNLAFLFETLSF
jgi:hypothetical protein